MSRRRTARWTADDTALRDVRQAVTGILAREGCRIPEALAIEIHQAYTGRRWIPPDDGPAYCPTHESTKMPCGMCRAEGN